MDRLKEVSIMVHLIVSICTDQFNLQNHLAGKGVWKSHKEHFIYHQKYKVLQPPVFAFQPFLLLIFFSALYLAYTVMLFYFDFVCTKQRFEQKPNLP